MSILEDLLSAHRSPDVFRPTDYLWLLLYESLVGHCDVLNDIARESPGGHVPVGEFRLRAVDAGQIFDVFFWDLDFLPYEDGMIPNPEQRKSVDMGDQIFGITKGLQPHPSELQLTKVNPTAWDDDDGELFREGSDTYPDFPIDDDDSVVVT